MRAPIPVNDTIVIDDTRAIGAVTGAVQHNISVGGGDERGGIGENYAAIVVFGPRATTGNSRHSDQSSTNDGMTYRAIELDTFIIICRCDRPTSSTM